MASNLLPLLLAGGAVAVISSKKKKKKGTSYEMMEVPYAPPNVKTSGPPAQTASKETWMQRQKALAYLGGIGFCECNPGAIDGIYGTATKNAIRSFQRTVGISTDGIWGPNTDKIMGQTLAAAATGLLKLPKKKAAPPVSVGAREIYISPDYQTLKIGESWKIAVLDKFLEERRRNGRLITDPKGTTFFEFIWNDPSQFLGETLGLKDKNARIAGHIIYSALWAVATGGLAASAAIAGSASLATYISFGFMMSQLGITSGQIINDLGDIYPKWRSGGFETLAASGLEAILRFSQSHFVKVGNKEVRIDKLPMDKTAVLKFNKLITDYTYAFQMRTYEG